MLNEEQNPQALEETPLETEENKAETESSSLSSTDSKIPPFKQALKQTLDKLKNPKELFKNLINDKKKLYIVLGSFLFLVILIVVLSLFMGHKEPQKTSQKTLATSIKPSNDNAKNENEKEDKEKAENLNLPDLMGEGAFSSNESKERQVDAMIKKASILYEQGQKNEALHLFDKIASFSQSIASHNLGVIKFKEKDLNGALDLFDSSIASKENASASAIDALVTAYHLQDADLYYHYLKIARDTLYKDYKKSFYSYAYALKSYYAEEYFEALSPLMHPNSNAFLKPNARLASKLFLMFKDEKNAYENLQKSAKTKDELALGLLQARLGNYDEALEHLKRFLQHYPNDLNALMATEIVSLKRGDMSSASEILKMVSHKKKQIPLANSFYPIKPLLRSFFLDKELAKDFFWNDKYFQGKRDSIYRILFYYAPFKIVDSYEALGVIQEGLFLLESETQKDLKGASMALKRGRMIALADKNSLKGLKELEQKRLRKALHYFKLALKNSPNNALTHYNVGLIYAQLEDYYKAYFHFLRAFHLNSADYLSAVFALMASHFTHEDNAELLREVTENFYSQDFSSPTQKAFLGSLVAFLNHRGNWDMDWLENAPKKIPFYYALQAVFAKESRDKKLAIESFARLKAMMPKDLLSHILYEIISYYNANIRHTLSIYTLLDSNSIDLEQTMLGPILGRNFYAYMGFIVGDLDKQEKLIEKKLASLEEGEEPNDLLQNLALVSLLQGKYVKASALYQNLIEGLKDSDIRLKILASLAHIAQGNYNNAVLLLELGKLDEPKNEDIRYALGLLYQQKGDLKAALNHFLAIRTSNFSSDYFDFKIDTDILKKRLDKEKKGEFLE
nr:tetratricopeptide repeat protein [Helicobacter cetorum]